MENLKKTLLFVSTLLGLCFIGSALLPAQSVVDLTLQSAVEIAMDHSYRVRQLRLGIERQRKWLEAERADLKSKVYAHLKIPEISRLSEHKWNSDLGKDEIVRRNTRLWKMGLSIEQPVILFGYPTNGYLSLNNEMYRYVQLHNATRDIDYYNRYFVRFEQPFFQPNRLKNELEEAELDLEEREIEFLEDLVDILDDVGDDYYDLFELSYRDRVYSHQVEALRQVSEMARDIAQREPARSIEADQAQVEWANVQERLLQNQSDMRLESARLKQRLRLNSQDSLRVSSVVNIVPITVDVDQAIEYGYTLRPRLRKLAINKQQNELDLDNTRGWNSFRVDLEMTYGLEKKDERYQALWDQLDESYSVALNAYVPIWDWGKRKAQIEAREISIKKVELYIEETKNRIHSEIVNAISSLKEYQERAMTMRKNKDMAQKITAVNMSRYEAGKISLQDLLQTINRQRDTELNFLDAYLGYRRSLLALLKYTYYDYENKTSLLEWLRDKPVRNAH